jgi:hypothetical protein
MIDNSGAIGNYFVTVFALHNRIASFQCPTLTDCYAEVNRIASERGKLPTTRAIARRLKGKSGKLRLFDDPITIRAETDLITVCDHCLQASCWQGEFYCDDYKTAGVVKKTRAELAELQREHSSYWKSDAELAAI